MPKLNVCSVNCLYSHVKHRFDGEELNTVTAALSLINHERRLLSARVNQQRHQKSLLKVKVLIIITV